LHWYVNSKDPSPLKIWCCFGLNLVTENLICGFHLQKWHPDKHKGDSAATEKFQEINEAYNGKSFFCIVGFYRNINTMLLT